ncbi:MAG TPA: glycine zipper 2TM domain-containing protein [Rhodocyclaceae bacterium]|nr:glycine zipper 2TM domain-containing protein [Rhodocyclaceae bacterium]
MNRLSSLLLPLLLLLASAQHAAVAGDTKSTSAAYKAAQKKAASQYAADKKLCAEGSTSSIRMQCLRDAKAEYTKALTEAKRAADNKAAPSAASCADCGRVVEVTTGTKKGEGGPMGLIGGGVAGAILGHQLGGGTGKDVATIAGAAGGAYAGSKVEEKLRSTKFWSVKVRLDSGEERTFEFDHDPGLASGDLVKVSGDSVSRR